MMSGFLLNLLLIAPLLGLVSAGGHGGHKRVVIHVPYKVKTIHHTHTITKHLHHGGDDKYEVVGYTVGHPLDLGGHGGFGGGGGGHGLGGIGGGIGGGHLELDHSGGDYNFGGSGGFGGGGHNWLGR